MWILIPDEEGKEPWSGTISLDAQPDSWWTFELIRSVKGLGQLYSDTPFKDQGTVIGLADYQTRCTIIKPIVTNIDPGSAGELIDFHRTRIEGTCDSLLTGLAITDPEEKMFLGIEFFSATFSTWFAPPFHKTAFDSQSRTPSIDIKSDVPGRDAHCWAPPGQIRASTFRALGSYLGWRTAKRV